VPTTNCQGWVPRNHPLAMPDDPAMPNLPPPSGLMPPAALAGQSIYTALELPAVVSSVLGLRTLQGWGVDCALGSFPPVVTVTETKPDGSTRNIPLDFFYVTSLPRPDVQAQIGAACPAVYAAPDSFGTSLGGNAAFGWSVQLRSPITELGAHTFTILMTWSSQGHAGSASSVVRIQ
jgi:hypothetical protein